LQKDPLKFWEIEEITEIKESQDLCLLYYKQVSACY